MGRDPGGEYILQWIDQYAEELRIAWNASKCKNCRKSCFHNLKIFCEEWSAENEEKYSEN